MMEKIMNGIQRATKFLEKVNHVLGYVVIIAGMVAGIVHIVKWLIQK